MRVAPPSPRVPRPPPSVVYPTPARASSPRHVSWCRGRNRRMMRAPHPCPQLSSPRCNRRFNTSGSVACRIPMCLQYNNTQFIRFYGENKKAFQLNANRPLANILCFKVNRFEHIWGKGVVNPYTVKLKLNKFEHVGEGWGLAYGGMGTCVGLGPCVGEGWGGLGLGPVQTPPVDTQTQLKTLYSHNFVSMRQPSWINKNAFQ